MRLVVSSTDLPLGLMVGTLLPGGPHQADWQSLTGSPGFLLLPRARPEDMFAEQESRT